MLALLIFFSIPSALSAEEKADVLDELSLFDLRNLKIELASKKEESLFDAPLSSSVITRREIINSGATSIMEALRLAPGMIVREQTPGNFDIHIRGFDQVPPNSLFPYFVNTLSLVMIDNRPVYNYFNGGTFWETFPIELIDVEKINRTH